MKVQRMIGAGVAALGIGLVGVASFGGSAFADNSGNPNETAYWENYLDDETAVCYKVNFGETSEYGTFDAESKSVTLNPWQPSFGGSHWALLVVNGGSNDAIFPNPDDGEPYSPPLNGGGVIPQISHWIVCVAGTPPTTTTTTTTTSTTTTTTLPATTTTTSTTQPATTTTTPTTQPPATTTTTTTQPAATTTTTQPSVGVFPPAPTTTTAISPILPTTGNSDGELLVLGLALLAAGSSLVFLSRRAS